MAADPRRTRALQLLRQTGILRSNYEPPLLRLLWRLGINAPPPHFAGFLPTALATGLSFGLFWSVSMWLLVWPELSRSLSSLALVSACAGVLFGLTMASYYAYGRRKHRLPRWKDLQGPSAA